MNNNKNMAVLKVEVDYDRVPMPQNRHTNPTPSWCPKPVMLLMVTQSGHVTHGDTIRSCTFNKIYTL